MPQRRCAWSTAGSWARQNTSTCRTCGYKKPPCQNGCGNEHETRRLAGGLSSTEGGKSFGLSHLLVEAEKFQCVDFFFACKLRGDVELFQYLLSWSLTHQHWLCALVSRLRLEIGGRRIFSGASLGSFLQSLSAQAWRCTKPAVLRLFRGLHLRALLLSRLRIFRLRPNKTAAGPNSGTGSDQE